MLATFVVFLRDKRRNILVEVDLSFEFEAKAHHAIAHANVDHRGRSRAAQRRPRLTMRIHGSRATAFQTTPKTLHERQQLLHNPGRDPHTGCQI